MGDVIVKTVRPVRLKYFPLAYHIVEAIVRRIEQGELAIGEKLSTEAKMMEEYGVSRTVVREAMSRLQTAGLVETRHGVGTFVRDAGASSDLGRLTLPLSPADIRTIRDLIAMIELRTAFETEAAALAAIRAKAEHIDAMRKAMESISRLLAAGESAIEEDLLFHASLAEATGNGYFVELYKYFGKATIPRARIDSARFSAAVPADYMKSVNREHEYILNAIIRRDPESAKAAVRLHLTNSSERLRLIIEESGDQFSEVLFSSRPI